MNEAELRAFEKQRQPSRSLDDPNLTCYGCAHSAASAKFPSCPSGERPCCTCVRNTERAQWAQEKDGLAERWGASLVIDDSGTARVFDPFTGHAYNGAPYVRFPMDNYITLDQHEQQRFYEKHPEYVKPITFDADGNCQVVVGDLAG